MIIEISKIMLWRKLLSKSVCTYLFSFDIVFFCEIMFKISNMKKSEFTKVHVILIPFLCFVRFFIIHFAVSLLPKVSHDMLYVKSIMRD